MVACGFTDVVWSNFCNTPSCQNVYFEIKDVVLLEECCVILSAHLRTWFFFFLSVTLLKYSWSNDCSIQGILCTCFDTDLFGLFSSVILFSNFY